MLLQELVQLVWVNQKGGTGTMAAQAQALALTTHPTLAATPAGVWPATFQALRPTGSLVLSTARTPTATQVQALETRATAVTLAQAQVRACLWLACCPLPSVSM